MPQHTVSAEAWLYAATPGDITPGVDITPVDGTERLAALAGDLLDADEDFPAVSLDEHPGEGWPCVRVTLTPAEHGAILRHVRQREQEQD